MCFDNMNNEPKKLMKPGTETEAVAAGQRRIGKRVQAGGSGQAIGKRIGLAHIAPASTRLGPDNSTQVVDFPHLSTVRFFCEAMKSRNEKGRSLREFGGLGFSPLLRLALRAQSRPDMTNLVRPYAQNVTACCAKVRESPRSFTKVRTDQGRKSSIVRIVTGGSLFQPRMKHRLITDPEKTLNRERDANPDARHGTSGRVSTDL